MKHVNQAQHAANTYALNTHLEPILVTDSEGLLHYASGHVATFGKCDYCPQESWLIGSLCVTGCL